MLLPCIFLTDVYDKRLIFRIEMDLVSGYFRDVNLLPANFKVQIAPKIAFICLLYLNVML